MFFAIMGPNSDSLSMPTNVFYLAEDFLVTFYRFHSGVYNHGTWQTRHLF